MFFKTLGFCKVNNTKATYIFDIYIMFLRLKLLQLCNKLRDITGIHGRSRPN